MQEYWSRREFLKMVALGGPGLFLPPLVKIAKSEQKETNQNYPITEGKIARMDNNIYTQAVVVEERNGSPHITIIPFLANTSLLVRQKGPESEARIWPIEVMAQPDAFGVNNVEIQAIGGEVFEFSPEAFANRLEGTIIGMLEDYPGLEQTAFILQKENGSREEVFVSARGKARVAGEEYPNPYFLRNLPSMLRYGDKPQVALCGATLINTQRLSQKINIGTEFVVASDPEQLGELVCASGEQTFNESVSIHLAPQIISLTFDLPYGSRLPFVDVNNLQTPRT